MNRRFAAVLVPLLALGLTACTDDKADPKTALADSTSGIKAGNYTFSVTMPGGSSGKGVVHSPSKTAAIDFVSATEEGKGEMNFRFVDADRYLKLKVDMGETAEQLQSLQDVGDDPESAKLRDGLKSMVDMFSGKKWLRLDMSKVTSKEFNLQQDNPDMVGVSTLLGAAATAEGDSPIKGTLDATTVTDDKGLFGKSSFEGLDPAAGKAIPYEATLDSEGRLTKLVLDVPKLKNTPAGKWTAEFTGYGSAAQQQVPPAAEVEEAPDQAYAAINS
ncbi:hypothetical protein [Actinoplanes sp. TFC3]|uniref:hypothetical protein n=1 Tax=Actinoplanes sp. TFC3 TaxID=1710355 RepID=UPI00082C7F89|nr:hypothetical protein [Actinoplanes sp. TFC3]